MKNNYILPNTSPNFRKILRENKKEINKVAKNMTNDELQKYIWEKYKVYSLYFATIIRENGIKIGNKKVAQKDYVY